MSIGMLILTAIIECALWIACKDVKRRHARYFRRTGEQATRHAQRIVVSEPSRDPLRTLDPVPFERVSVAEARRVHMGR